MARIIRKIKKDKRTRIIKCLYSGCLGTGLICKNTQENHHLNGSIPLHVKAFRPQE